MTLTADGRFINVHSVSTKLSETYPADKFIPLQFTGHFDRNGVEIYEGDIVDAMVDDMFGDISRVAVEWLPTGYYKAFLGYERGEVIGNIYENPELLEPDKAIAAADKDADTV